MLTHVVYRAALRHLDSDTLRRTVDIAGATPHSANGELALRDTTLELVEYGSESALLITGPSPGQVRDTAAYLGFDPYSIHVHEITTHAPDGPPQLAVR